NATDADVTRLEEILRGDSFATDAYCEFLAMHAELYWQQDAILSGSRQTISKATISDGSSPNISGSWWLSLAALLLVGSCFGIMVASWVPRENVGVGDRGQIVDRLQAAELGQVVAVVSGSRNCRWKSSNAEQWPAVGYGSPLYSGQRLQLAEGLAEITFNNGVRIIVEAPSDLDLESVNGSTLHEGRLTASVPEGAEGFEVACKGITLVDRGTEFGVNCDQSGETEVHVFDGLVEGHVKDSEGSVFRKVSWKSNETALFDSSTNKFKDIEKPSPYIRSLSQTVGIQPGVLAIEDFEYPVGPLTLQNGGFGWGGPWESISIGDSLESNGIGAGSIPGSGIDQFGNHALLTGQFNRIRRNLSTSFSGVFDSAGFIENQDGVRLIG
ncbi:MAG: FecR domain-containing protein, partial [Planctomycetota bacterium]